MPLPTKEEALDFYTRKLRFGVAEDNKLSLLVRLPDNHEFSRPMTVLAGVVVHASRRRSLGLPGSAPNAVSETLALTTDS
jgi:hypothetical protein